MDYDQIELDAAYDQSAYAPLGYQITARRATNSEETRRRLGQPRREVLRTDRDREARHLPHARAERAGARLRPWRRVALRRVQRLPFRGGEFRHRGRALRRARFHRDRGRRRRSSQRWPSRSGAASPGSTRTRVRSAAIPNRIYVCGQSSGAHLAGVSLDHRLDARFRRAHGHHQGRDAPERHVRHEAGSPLAPQLLREVRRCDGRRDEHAAPPRAHQHAGDADLRHERDAGIPASEQGLRGCSSRGRQTGRARSSRPTTITTSCRRRSPIPMAGPAAPRSR